MMEPKLGETPYKDFIISDSTGAATDADSLPTCEVFEDGNDTAILSPTVVKRSGKTGNYRIPIACTTGNGFEANKSYNVIVSATVGGVAAKACVETFQVRANVAADVLAAMIAEPVATVTGSPTLTSITVTGLAASVTDAHKDQFARWQTGAQVGSTPFPVVTSIYSAPNTTLTFAGLFAVPQVGDELCLVGSRK